MDVLTKRYKGIQTMFSLGEILALSSPVSGFTGGSVLKNPPALQELHKTRVWSPGQKDPLEEEMATLSTILAWEIPWTEEPGRLQSTGLQSQTWLSDRAPSVTDLAWKVLWRLCDTSFADQLVIWLKLRLWFCSWALGKNRNPRTRALLWRIDSRGWLTKFSNHLSDGEKYCKYLFFSIAAVDVIIRSHWYRKTYNTD